MKTHLWYGIDSNASGVNVAAVQNGGTIWTSTNYGSDWNSIGDIDLSGRLWNGIASDSTGNKLAAVAAPRINPTLSGGIWISNDRGSSWEKVALSDASNNWTSIASNPDGTILAATSYGGNIWIGKYTQSTWAWTQQASPANWMSISIDSLGNLAAVATDPSGGLWTSTDSGISWTKNIIDVSNNWTSITSNSDGTLIAAANGDYVRRLAGPANSTPVSGSTNIDLCNVIVDGIRSDYHNNNIVGGI